MSIMEKDYVVFMPDGSQWAIPVNIIAYNHALKQAHHFNNNVEQSLEQGTMPLFSSDYSLIHNWAVNELKWNDIRKYARCVQYPDIDWQYGWKNGNYMID